MLFSADQIILWTQSYCWPFLRVSALLLAAPIFGADSFPVRARILLGVFITVLLVPVLPEMPVMDPMSPIGLVLISQQLLIGLSMGFILQMMFAAVVIAGQSLAVTMGLGFAMSVDPQNGVQVPVLSQFYVILATLIFLSVDGHLALLHLLGQSFELLPVGGAFWDAQSAMRLVTWASQMFALALLMALPTLTALLLINLAFGVITRAAPQLNIFAVGFPVTILAGFIFILLSLPSVTDLLIKMFDNGLTQSILLLP
ncbi:flagellar biosynthetic protein FliR [Porticoccus sp.]